MDKSGILEHKGIVLALNHGWVDVAVQAENACTGCRVKGACGMGDQEEKVVAVATEMPEAYRVGEEVVVFVERRMGFRAVFLAYVIPLILLLASLLTLLDAGLGETAAGLLSLGTLVCYYVVLRLFRSRIHREIIFKIKKTQ